MKVYIQAITYYLPDKILTNEQLVEEFPEWSVEKIGKKIGISMRHVASEDETAGDLAFMAAEKLVDEYQIDRSSIDFLLLCTQSPDYYLPSTSCVIQNKLGLSTRCGALDFNLGCSGYEYGLAVAKGLIVGGIAKNVLLLTAETYTKHIHPRDKGNKTIFGDGASASLISTKGFAEVREFVLGTDGCGYDKLIRKSGSDFLYMDGKAIFDFTADIVPPMIEETLKINCLTNDDINLYVFHQANKYMINYLRKLMEIDKDRFYIFMENVGNTVSSTIPIALCEAQKEGKLHGNVLLAGFGVGLSYGATILKCI